LGPELVRDLVSLIQRAETDDACQVLVFTSADTDYFISHVDVTRISEYREQAAKLTGEPSIAILFRYLSASRLVTIAQVAGRVRGAGSEFVLACDMRFAARESAIDALRRRRGSGPQDLLRSIVDEVQRFSPHEQYDDITMIVCRVRGD
jgi:enoyl-CoA hydratase/carnithine racemase